MEILKELLKENEAIMRSHAVRANQRISSDLLLKISTEILICPDVLKRLCTECLKTDAWIPISSVY